MVASQASVACKTMNGTDLAGRTIMVREDREDRDVKVDGEAAPKREPRAPRPPREPREYVPREPRERRERAPRPPRDTSGSSGLQVVVQGIPWSYDKAALEDMFTSFKPEYQVESAEVVFGRDGRSRVRARAALLLLCGCSRLRLRLRCARCHLWTRAARGALTLCCAAPVVARSSGGAQHTVAAACYLSVLSLLCASAPRVPQSLRLDV